MTLKISNFLCYYQFHPLTNDFKQKSNCALIAKVILIWALTLGIVPIICRLAFYSHTYRIIKPTEEPKIVSIAQSAISDPLSEDPSSPRPSTPLSKETSSPSPRPSPRPRPKAISIPPPNLKIEEPQITPSQPASTPPPPKSTPPPPSRLPPKPPIASPTQTPTPSKKSVHPPAPMRSPPPRPSPLPLASPPLQPLSSPQQSPLPLSSPPLQSLSSPPPQQSPISPLSPPLLSLGSKSKSEILPRPTPPTRKPPPPPIPTPLDLNASKSSAPNSAIKSLKVFHIPEASPLKKSLPTSVLKPIKQAANKRQSDISEMSIRDWLNSEQSSDINIRFSKRILSPEQKGKIDQHLEAWNKHFDLNARMNTLKDPNTIKIKDIMEEWDDAAARYALMQREELEGMKVSDLTSVNQVKLAQQFKKLPPSIQSPRNENISDLAKEKIPQLFLMDLSKITVEQFNEFAEHLPPITLSFLFNDPKNDLSKLAVNKLNTAQLHFIFASSDLLEKLTSDQIDACIGKVEKFELLDNLNEAQILLLNYSLLDEKLFQAIFGPNKRSDLIPTLSKENIPLLCKFFVEDDWRILTDNQAFNFNLDVIEDEKKRQGVFHLLFDANRIAKMDLPKIYFFMGHFKEKHWGQLTDDRAIQFDFSKIKVEEERRKIFNQLFDPIQHTQRIRRMSLDKIHKNISLFTVDHWKQLAEKQITGLDYSKIEETNREEVFEAIFPGTDYLDKLKLEQLQEIYSYFKGKHWAKISVEQVKQFDLAKANAEFVKKLFEGERHAKFFDALSEGNKKAVQNLKAS